MANKALWLAILITATAGCATVPRGTEALHDPAGNLTGDTARGYVDVLEARVSEEDDSLVLEVEVAEPFPTPADMRAGQWVDYIWLVDIDRDPSTGQFEFGNDYNVHIELNPQGWHHQFIKVSTVSQRDGIEATPDAFSVQVDGTRAKLTFPRRYLPAEAFDWRLLATTDNSSAEWDPVTVNPMSKPVPFGPVGFAGGPVTPYKAHDCTRF